MRLIDNAQIVSGFIPVDTQTGENVGDVVNLENYNHLTVVFFKAVGVANENPVFTYEQGTDVAFGTNAVLATIDEYWKKEGADLAAIGTFTRVTQTASETVTLSATSAESAGLYIFEVDATDLTDGYSCVRVTVADTGAAGAQLGCMLYVLSEPRHAAAVMPSAIA